MAPFSVFPIFTPDARVIKGVVKPYTWLPDFLLINSTVWLISSSKSSVLLSKFSSDSLTLSFGFGKSPKFPKPHDYLFLLKYSLRDPGSKSFEMVEKSGAIEI